MSEIIILDNEQITVKYIPEKKLIHHTIHQPIDGQPFRDAMDAGTEALEMYGATKWLSDDRKNGPLSPEVAEWGFNDWNPRTIRAGWRYWAMVVPENVIAAGNLAPTIEDLYKLGLRVMVFSDLDRAMAWLDKMP